MKKRTLSLLLSIACVLSLSLSACGNETAAPSASPSAPVDTETPAAEVDQTREIVFAASRICALQSSVSAVVATMTGVLEDTQ